MKHAVVTIANFDFTDRNYLAMANMWIDSLSRNYDGPIKVFSESDISHHFQSTRVEFIVEPERSEILVPDIESKLKHPSLAYHNIWYKLYHICKFDFPFVFIDLDTYIFESIDPLIKACKDKPYVASDQRNIYNIPGFPNRYLNTGVQVINDPFFLNWEGVIEMAKRDDYRAVSGGSEQALLYSYFNQIGYDYSVPEFDDRWNAPACKVSTFKTNDGWAGRINGETANIIHYFGHSSKPWNIGCKIFHEYYNLLQS